MNSDLQQSSEISTSEEIVQEWIKKCELEQIHKLGLIQPHGFLIILDARWKIQQFSDNINNWIAIPKEEILNQPLSGWLDSRLFEKIQNLIFKENRGHSTSFLENTQFQSWVSQDTFDLYLHQMNNLVYTEWIPAKTCNIFNPFDNNFINPTSAKMEILSEGIQKFSDRPDPAQFAEWACEQIQKLSNIDRVLVYRFDQHWNGEVIAERTKPGISSYLGLWFPSSDIPSKVREIYSTKAFRFLVDVQSRPVGMYQSPLSLNSELPDLSYSVLRDCSRSHKSYLRNMGVRATLTISIIHKGKLWGLISCNNEQVYFPPNWLINFVCTLSELMSSNLSRFEEYQIRQGTNLGQQMLRDMILKLRESSHWSDILFDPLDGLNHPIKSDGLALKLKEKTKTQGIVPSQQKIDMLIDWLEETGQTFIVTSHLGQLNPLFLEDTETCAGILAIRIPKISQCWIIWFRGEAKRTVRWAGNPNNNGLIHDSGSTQLEPQRSFKIWCEKTKNRSIEWDIVEITLAKETIRLNVLDLILEWQQKQKIATYQETGNLLHQVQDGILVINSRGFITYSNDSANHLLELGEFPHDRTTLLEKLREKQNSSLYLYFEKILKKWLPEQSLLEEITIYSAGFKEAKTLEIRVQMVYPETETNSNYMFLIRDISEKKRTLETLIASENRFRAFAESTNVFIWISDCENRCTYGNPRWAEFLGKTTEDLIGLVRHPYVHPDDQERILALCVEVHEQKKSYRFECRVRRCDGTYRWMLENAIPHFDAHGQLIGYLASAVDITELKEAQLQLEARKNHLSQLINKVNVGILIGSPDGIIIDCNLTGLDILGRTRESIIGHHYLELDWQPRYNDGESVPIGSGPISVSLQKATSIRDMILEINRPLLKDRIWIQFSLEIWRNEHGQIELNLFSFYDITPLRQALKQAEESKKLYRLLAESIADIIFLLDRKGNFLYVSPSFETQLGFSTQNLISQPIIKWVHPEDQFRFKAMMTQVLSIKLDPVAKESTIPINYIDWRCLHQQGYYLDMGSTIRIIPPDSEQIGQLIFCSRDLSEQKKLQEQLRSKQRIEALGKLAGGIAHDFNNILQVIRGYIELLSAEQMNSNSTTAILKEMDQTAYRGSMLTQQLLAFARKQTLKKVVLDLHEVVTNFSTILKRILGDRIQLDIETSPIPLYIFADRGQIEQILMNLAVNARDAVLLNGQIHIKIVPLSKCEAQQMGFTDLNQEMYAQIQFSDNGCGISPINLPHLFEPFFTTKEIGKGTGLGLSVVYGIIQSYQGQIRVSSREHQGTDFFILLPIYQTGVIDSQEKKSVRSNREKEKILLVEDDVGVRRLTSILIHSEGYQVLEVDSPSQVLDILDQKSDPIDLIITDLMMPEMSGTELASLIKIKYPEMKLLFISGYTGDSQETYGIRTADHHYLQKPFTKQELIEKIRFILN